MTPLTPYYPSPSPARSLPSCAKYAMPPPSPSTANSKLLTPNWTYTFSAKEKDVETGLSYFGSRYYSPNLSIWLSVDPMSDKYASLSPYVYCANNPVKLVDPNGEEIWIIGTERELFYEQLKEGASLLGISTSIDKNGVIRAEYIGEGEMSMDAEKLLNAFNSLDVLVTIIANNSDKIDGKPFFGGAFGGNRIYEQDGTKRAVAFQYVNPNDLERLNQCEGFAVHEVSEAYEGAMISMQRDVSSGFSNDPNSVYKEAHNAAIAQPYFLNKYYFNKRGSQIKAVANVFFR